MPDAADRPGRPAYHFWYDPKARAIVWQLIVAAFLTYGLYAVVSNAFDNMAKAGIASGFNFLTTRAGFDVLFHLVDFTSDSSYGMAFVVGVLNTALIAASSIVLCTILGFAVGISRLSRNFLLRSLATTYVEVFRNVPLIIQLYFWYKGVLAFLPGPRQSYFLPLGINLSNRGLIVPRPLPGPLFPATEAALGLAVIAAVLVVRWARARQAATGAQFPTLNAVAALIVGVPLVTYLATGLPLAFEVPVLKGFNFAGGLTLPPEFVALLLGLSVYTSAYVAETVRGGILAVSHGQIEAAGALGLKRGQMMKLIVVPQALRTMIPPLTNTYVNLIKDSSLGVTVGYPDLVSIFTGTVLNQTGQAVEVIFITMLVYLLINLIAAVLMNWLNTRWALKER